MKQRIIKFRQWNIKRKQMFYDANFPFDGNEISMNRQIELSQGIGTIWMQFTGLLDRHGREIYEGDILIDDDTGEIDYAKVEWLEREDFIGWFANPWGKARESFVDYEIIGNIYENPELLGDGRSTGEVNIK